MYCRNCGKEIGDKDKFCKYCGTCFKNSLLEDETNKKQNTTSDISMRYFKFFTNILLTIMIFLNMLGLISFNQVKEWNFYAVSILILHILLYIAVPLKLIIELPKKTKFSFILLISFFILDYIYKVITVSFDTYFKYYNNELFVYIIMAIVLYSIWYIPNFVYFIKRKKIFVN